MICTIKLKNQRVIDFIVIMKEEKDHLDDLFVEEGNINKELVRRILIDYVRLTREGGIIPLDNFNKLSASAKILIVLLSKRAMAAKEICSEYVSPKEISDLTGLATGTVNPTVRTLQGSGLVKNEGGKYKLPNYALSQVEKFLMSNSAKGKDAPKQGLRYPTKKATRKMSSLATPKSDTKSPKNNRKRKGDSIPNYLLKFLPPLKEMIQEGFFNQSRRCTLTEIVNRFDEKGHTIIGAKRGTLATALSLFCKKGTLPLERRHISKEEKTGSEKYVYCLKSSHEISKRTDK